MADNSFGEYVRARRESLHPDVVGLARDNRRRRVAGLRREEVAALAGISSEYYTRLEQGREQHPSAQVITAIARALALEPTSHEYLQRLVHPLPDRGFTSASNAGVAAFVDALAAPAFAHDRVLDVIAANPAGEALLGVARVGVNLLREAFLGSHVRELYVNFDEMTTRLVGYLRTQAVTPPPDPRLPALVAELSAESSRFAELWSRQEVGTIPRGTNDLRHPTAGRLLLHFERLCFAGTDHPVILVYHAEPGSASDAALRSLVAGASATA